MQTTSVFYIIGLALCGIILYRTTARKRKKIEARATAELVDIILADQLSLQSAFQHLKSGNLFGIDAYRSYFKEPWAGPLEISIEIILKMAIQQAQNLITFHLHSPEVKEAKRKFVTFFNDNLRLEDGTENNTWSFGSEGRQNKILYVRLKGITERFR